MIHRIDVSARGDDLLGDLVRQDILDAGFDVGTIRTSRIFLIDAPSASPDDLQRAASELLADPIVEIATVADSIVDASESSRIEVHLKPGVMDPVADSTVMALRDMGIDARQVRTGRSFVIDAKIPQGHLQQIASRTLANGVIESVHFTPFRPAEFEAGHEQPFQLRHVELTKLNDTELKVLSRTGHLFLSLTEMQAVQSYYRGQQREPTDIELETIAQTWSEHCVHKTLKSAVDVVDESGQTIRHYDNLIKETIFGATSTLMKTAAMSSFCLSVFKDNAGVIAFDDRDAVCFKVETHNHPSAIEPYGGAATGAGGCIRDILGTGLGAKPIANSDVFCVANVVGSGFGVQGSAKSRQHSPLLNPEPQTLNPLPKGVIHPKRVLQQVVAGVRDYGNRMGIPTVNGAVYFDDRYIGNPLVFCGCVGLIPRDKIVKAARAGDAIVVMGGRTGRDGIHGATFSSAELTDTHADEFSHAVQIGNAITEKKVADVLLQARDRDLFTAVTDCGAGGLSSAVGEMGEKLGATVHLDRVPLKYAGLRYDEIWISEAQERMVLSVPATHVEELLALSKSEDVESTVIGTFGTNGAELILNFRNEEVGRLSMHFLHDGIPLPTRTAKLTNGTPRVTGVPPVPAIHQIEQTNSRNDAARHGRDARDTRSALLALLAHPNIASKHWIIRQYDHEVQGGSIVKPLVGPLQIGPSDAAVIRPKLDSHKAVAIACGMNPAITDPYDMAIASIDEAIRNAVCVGANPDQMAMLDNFCWPSCDDEETMGTLVRACEACRDAALAFGVPFISGKDSLHNQFTNSETGEVIKIPRTLLISTIAVLDDFRKCVTMNLKGGRDSVVAVARPKELSLASLSRAHRAMATLLSHGQVTACHDSSDGGVLVAIAEMCIASNLGVSIDATHLGHPFIETLATYLIELSVESLPAAEEILAAGGMSLQVVGTVSSAHSALSIDAGQSDNSTTDDLNISIAEMTAAWRGTLDW